MRPMGLLALLDDEVRIPRGTDLGFIDKLTKSFSAMPEFKRSKGQQLEFMIQHFAGQVSKLPMHAVTSDSIVTLTMCV